MMPMQPDMQPPLLYRRAPCTSGPGGARRRLLQQRLVLPKSGRSTAYPRPSRPKAPPPLPRMYQATLERFVPPSAVAPLQPAKDPPQHAKSRYRRPQTFRNKARSQRLKQLTLSRWYRVVRRSHQSPRMLQCVASSSPE